MLSEVPHELSTDAHSKECKRSPQQFIPAGFPLTTNLQPGDGRLRRMFSHTGHGPFRTLIVSNLNGEDPVAATTCFRQADIKSSTIFYKRRIEGISYFLYTVALSGRDKVRPRT